jgi:hypothetical protein
MYPTTGHTYPKEKVCIRCFHTHSDELYQLCAVCRANDAAWMAIFDENAAAEKEQPDPEQMDIETAYTLSWIDDAPLYIPEITTVPYVTGGEVTERPI